MSKLIKDMAGMTFTRLTVIARAPSDKNGNAKWHCQCACGNKTISSGFTLRNGEAKSCGCLTTDQLRERITSHGMTGSSEWRTWGDMIQRCTNPNNTKYKLYGGRGIKVCDRWRTFEHFYTDMGPKPTSKHSIERRDGNKNYEPANCYWADIIRQNNNTSRNRMVEYQGKTMSLSDAIRLGGTDAAYGTVQYRLKTGWSVADAVEKPRNPRVRNQYSG